MNNYYKSTILIFIIASFLGTKAFAQHKKVTLIEAFLADAHRSGAFNGNILISEGGKVIVRKAIGYADASKKVPLTAQHRFHIGSVAKEFDAVGVMMLVEQGRLSLDDKVSTFFPELPAWASKIAIKQLLQYTSGLPEIKYKTVKRDADHWKDLQALEKLDFEPGSRYAYNNNNTFMRRRIIEKVAGMPFDDFVQKHILKVAGINHGIVDPVDSDTLVARSFNNDFKQDGLEVPISGWTCLNIDDFYRWSKCIDSFRLISAESTREILIPYGPDSQSGLGGGTMKGNKIMSHVHDGSGAHYQALLLTEAAKGRTIIILTNQKQGNVYELAAAVQAILDDKSGE